MLRTGAIVALTMLATLAAPPLAGAVVTFERGANKVSTSRVELDFGDAGGNVERVDSVRWRDSADVPRVTARASGARRKPVVIARSAVFDIPAGKKEKVSAKVTRAGRKLLRKGWRVQAAIRVTNVSPLGQEKTRSFKVTLLRRR